jgi:mannitol-1-/sugar-/sorbitol-6-/2-deoxyglucose-6-phosphatase
MIEAVVFDMDGVIIDSEPVWQQVRVDLVTEHGAIWTDADGDACRGSESEVWSTMVSMRLGGLMTPNEVFDEILARMAASYKHHLPLFDGAVETIERVALEHRVAVASGSPRVLVDLVLATSGLDRVTEAVGCGDEVERGKPAPDIYLDVLERMGVEPRRSVGVEDSVAGLTAVLAAGMHAIAVVSPGYEIPYEILERTDARLDSLADLTIPTYG